MPQEQKKEEKPVFDIRTFFITSIITAMSLVVGLFWKDVITLAVEQIVKGGDGLYAKTISAIAVTLIIGVVIYLIYRSQKIASKYESVVKDTVRKHQTRLDQKRKRYAEILKGSEWD